MPRPPLLGYLQSGGAVSNETAHTQMDNPDLFPRNSNHIFPDHKNKIPETLIPFHRNHSGATPIR